MSYTKVKHLQYDNSLLILKFETSFSQPDFVTSLLEKNCQHSGSLEMLPEPQPYPSDTGTLSEDKEHDLKSMLQFMPPEVDRTYLNTLRASREPNSSCSIMD